MKYRPGPVSILLCGIALYSVFAEHVAPYPAIREHRELPFTPPMELHWGGFASPYYCDLQSAGTWRGFTEDCTRRWEFRFFEEGRLWQPSRESPFFLLGSDDLGRDQFSRMMEGGRVTLSAGVAAAVITILTGIEIGIDVVGAPPSAAADVPEMQPCIAQFSQKGRLSPHAHGLWAP